CFCSFFSSRRRHTRSKRDWSSDVCSSDLAIASSGSPSKLIRVNPSNTWSSTALEVVSDEVPGCNDGGSDLILIRRDCSAPSPPSASSESSGFSVVTSSASSGVSAGSLSPPQAANKTLITTTSVKNISNLFQFIK